MTACAVVALGFSGVVASQASAATIAVPQACVVDRPYSLGSQMVVVGQGFTPNDFVGLSTNTGGGSGSATVGADGSFTVAITAPILPTPGPAVSTFTLTAADVTDGLTTASTTFQVANLAANANPSRAKVGKKVTFDFSGFTAGAEIYGHYLHRGKLVTTMRMGRTGGPCGTLRTRAPLFPRGIRYQAYQVQYDDSRRYSKRSLPRVTATLTPVAF